LYEKDGSLHLVCIVKIRKLVTDGNKMFCVVLPALCCSVQRNHGE